MNKDTLTGMLLIFAVLFGFMYCNQPDPNAAKNDTPSGQNADTKVADVQNVTLTDTLGAADFQALEKVVRASGSPVEGESGRYRFEQGALYAEADSTGVSGYVKTGGGNVDLSLLATLSSELLPEQRNEAMQQVRNSISAAMKYKSFARYLGGADSTVTLTNGLLTVNFASRGGKVGSVVLNKYKTENGEQPHDVELFNTNTGDYSFAMRTADQVLNTSEFNFIPVVESDTTVLMRLDLGENVWWGLRYTLVPGQYLVRMDVVQQGMGAVLPQGTTQMSFSWNQKMVRNEKGRTFEERNSAIYYKVKGDSPEDLSANDDDSESLSAAVKWVAFKNQFFSSVIIPKATFSSAELNSAVLKKDVDFLKQMDMDATLPYGVQDGTAASFDFFFGPNDYPMLSDLDDVLGADEDLDLNRLVPLGWGIFRWVNQLIIIPVFSFLGSFISSYGIIILLLTIFIKIILFPFTYKSYKSQAKMRVLAPEIKEINEKYPGNENAMQRQQATMALYSRVGASPFSGCLPMLLQMPVLIAMFSFFPSAIELRGQSFLWASDLSAPDVICTLPFSIPFYGNHVSLFCLLMTVVNIIYTKINMANQPGGNSMPGMKWMMYLMPVMFLFFFNDYASGLSYYYFLSLLITIIQTWVARKFIDEKKVRAELMANAKKPKKKSGFMARLEEAQRQQQAALRAQQQKGKRR
ncbi:MAG: membrane protein insertase YidC [Muribaculaceae bacterium]|nr:membrane protein insertase YidC [Muribaculaceae bacterium]